MVVCVYLYFFLISECVDRVQSNEVSVGVGMHQSLQTNRERRLAN